MITTPWAPWRPDDKPLASPDCFAVVDAEVGNPYILERRTGPLGPVIRLARGQRNAQIVSIALGAPDARRVAAALIAAAEQLESKE